MDFFLAAWPRHTPAVAPAWEMGKFRLDTIKSPVSDVFTGPLVLTPLQLQESLRYYGKDYVNPAEGQADHFKQSKTVVLNVICSEGEPLSLWRNEPSLNTQADWTQTQPIHISSNKCLRPLFYYQSVSIFQIWVWSECISEEFECRRCAA